MTFKILTAEIYHETNTFSRHPTDEQAFRDRYFLTGAEAIAQRGDANTELAGFLDVGRSYGWQVEHVLSSAAGPSGRVTRAAFDWLSEPLIAAAKLGNFDGILLGLHGAMVPDFCEDGEGELLRRLRAQVGQAVPIAITLDPHANVSRQMCELADIIVAFKTYPHVDMREIGRQAGEILQRTMAGEIKPHTISARRPMLEEVNGGRTDIGPMLERLASARAYEAQADVFAVSINGGFASADIAEVGPTVLVTGQGDFDVHQSFAEKIADDIWARRHEVLNEYVSVETAAAVAVAYKSADGPLVIADYADNPGGGGYGDSTNLLRAMLDAGVTDACFGPMVDGEAVATLQSSAVGRRINIALGGKTDARFGGGPLQLNAEIVALSDGRFVGDGPMIGGLPGNFGPTVVLRVEGIEVLVVTIAQQMLDLQQFKAFGIDPALKRVVALKSMQHFRAAFAPIAGKIIVCDSGALCTPHYERMPYCNVPRPIFPLDQE